MSKKAKKKTNHKKKRLQRKEEKKGQDEKVESINIISYVVQSKRYCAKILLLLQMKVTHKKSTRVKVFKKYQLLNILK